MPSIWYQIDAGDAYPATFFLCVGQGAARAALRKGEVLPLFPPEASVDPATFAQRYFRALFARLPGAAVLVLDNFQDAGRTPFDAVARPMLEQVPAGRRVIVLSLTEPPAHVAGYATFGANCFGRMSAATCGYRFVARRAAALP